MTTSDVVPVELERVRGWLDKLREVPHDIDHPCQVAADEMAAWLEDQESREA
jgi:hypothetical protein